MHLSLFTYSPFLFSEARFSFVNAEGTTVTGLGRTAPLLFYGGTVCSNGFIDNSGQAICREMGFEAGADRWTRVGDVDRSIKNREEYDIAIGDVICSDVYWESCRYNFDTSDCHQNDDVFLACSPGTSTPILAKKLGSGQAKYQKDLNFNNFWLPVPGRNR